MKCTIPQRERIVSERFYDACDFKILNPHDTVLGAPGNTLIGYCKTDYVLIFFQKCRQNPDTKYVLITHESDYGITPELFYQKPPNVIKWYGQNIEHFHPVLESIPIGSHVSTWIGTLKDADIKDHPDFVVVPETGVPKLHTNLAYMDFGVWTNSTHRKSVYDYFKTKDWVTSKKCDADEKDYRNSTEFVTIAKQCKNIYDHKFVISPLGNGVDCGRNWLALYLGTIPVIPWHQNMEFYKELPFVVYHDIEEVTEEFLNNKYEEIMSSAPNLEKATVSYWISKFKAHKVA